MKKFLALCLVAMIAVSTSVSAQTKKTSFLRSITSIFSKKKQSQFLAVDSLKSFTPVSQQGVDFKNSNEDRLIMMDYMWWDDFIRDASKKPFLMGVLYQNFGTRFGPVIFKTYALEWSPDFSFFYQQ